MCSSEFSFLWRNSAMVACAFLVTACNPQAQSGEPSAELRANIEALAARSIQRLSFVPAGGFWLGDPGPLMTEEAKSNGTVLGPEAKITNLTSYTYSEDNKPPRWVTLDAFSMQQLKVTYGDFDVYTEANGLAKHPPKGDENTFGNIWVRARKTDDTPAGVTWPQARAYCQWLGKVTGLPFDLPTEAQWEFAASSGRKTHWEPQPTDNGILERGRNHPDHEWIAKQIGALTTSPYPAGRWPGSMLGLHDMVGNGYDWTLDWYAPDAYSSMTETHNPKGPASGAEKVKRGYPLGEDMAIGFPHTVRYSDKPAGKTSDEGRLQAYVREGFRCVVNQPTPIPGSNTLTVPPVRNVLK